MIEPKTLAAALRVTQGGANRAMQAVQRLAGEAAQREAALARMTSAAESAAAESARRGRPAPAARRINPMRRSEIARTQDHGHAGA